MVALPVAPSHLTVVPSRHPHPARRKDDTVTTAPSIPASAAKRLWSHIEKTDGCWHWTGPRRHLGFPEFRVGNEPWLPARLVFELTYGAVPSGVSVIRTCTTAHCCRPDHHARRDQFAPVPVGTKYLFQVVADDLFPDILPGDHVAIGPLPEPLTPGVAVLARDRRRDQLILRRLVAAGDGWALVAHHGMTPPIPVTDEIEVVGAVVVTLRSYRNQADAPPPAA